MERSATAVSVWPMVMYRWGRGGTPACGCRYYNMLHVGGGWEAASCKVGELGVGHDRGMG